MLIVSKIKLTARYVVLGFFMYLAYTMVQPGYANAIAKVGEIATSAMYVVKETT